MAKDPVCGMFVEEKPGTIQYNKDGRIYYFCSTQCLNEFIQPEKELRKLKTVCCHKYWTNYPHSILELASYVFCTV